MGDELLELDAALVHKINGHVIATGAVSEGTLDTDFFDQHSDHGYQNVWLAGAHLDIGTTTFRQKNACLDAHFGTRAVNDQYPDRVRQGQTWLRWPVRGVGRR